MLDDLSSMRAQLTTASSWMHDDDVAVGDDDENDTVAGDDGTARDDGAKALTPGCLIA
jgi:hypothetical protein